MILPGIDAGLAAHTLLGSPQRDTAPGVFFGVSPSSWGRGGWGPFLRYPAGGGHV